MLTIHEKGRCNALEDEEEVQIISTNHYSSLIERAAVPKHYLDALLKRKDSEK